MTGDRCGLLGDRWVTDPNPLRSPPKTAPDLRRRLRVTEGDRYSSTTRIHTRKGVNADKWSLRSPASCKTPSDLHRHRVTDRSPNHPRDAAGADREAASAAGVEAGDG